MRRAAKQIKSEITLLERAMKAWPELNISIKNHPSSRSGKTHTTQPTGTRVSVCHSDSDWTKYESHNGAYGRATSYCDARKQMCTNHINERFQFDRSILCAYVSISRSISTRLYWMDPTLDPFHIHFFHIFLLSRFLFISTFISCFFFVCALKRSQPMCTAAATNGMCATTCDSSPINHRRDFNFTWISTPKYHRRNDSLSKFSTPKLAKWRHLSVCIWLYSFRSASFSELSFPPCMRKVFMIVSNAILFCVCIIQHRYRGRRDSCAQITDGTIGTMTVETTSTFFDSSTQTGESRKLHK